jgi:hypothetical protein
MPTIAFTVNEVHTSRQIVELTADEFRAYSQLRTEEARARFIQDLNRDWDLVDNSLEFSRHLEETMRDFEVIDKGETETESGNQDLPRVRVQFVAQYTSADGESVYDLPPMGEDTFDVTEELIAMGREAATALASDTEESDVLKDAATAPEWVRNWPGPYKIEVPFDDQIERLFDALEARNSTQ